MKTTETVDTLLQYTADKIKRIEEIIDIIGLKKEELYNEKERQILKKLLDILREEFYEYLLKLNLLIDEDFLKGLSLQESDIAWTIPHVLAMNCFLERLKKESKINLNVALTLRKEKTCVGFIARDVSEYERHMLLRKYQEGFIPLMEVKDFTDNENLDVIFTPSIQHRFIMQEINDLKKLMDNK